MAIERHVVTVIQVEYLVDGLPRGTGEDRYYVLGNGDYNETCAALTAAQFQPYDRLGDIVDARLRDEKA